MQVQLRLPVDDPLGHRLGHTGGVRDPHRLRDPEPVQPRMLAQQWHPVAGEREQPVEPAVEPRLGQRRDQLDGRLPRRLEVLLGERLLGPGDVLRPDRHGPMSVRPNAHRLPVRPEVEVGVLVPQNRLPRQHFRADRQITRERVLVRHRHQRNGQPDHLPQHRPPHPGTRHDDVGGIGAGLGAHPGDPITGRLDRDHLLPELEPRASLHRPPSLDLGRQHGLREPVARNQEPAQNPVPVHQRVQRRHLVRPDEPALHTPRRRPAVPTREIRQPGLGGGDLQAADLVEAPQTGVLLDRVAREGRHAPAGVRLEHEPRRVAARPSGGEALRLVQDRDVGEATSGELVGQRTADDPRPHEHHARHISRHLDTLRRRCAERNLFRYLQQGASSASCCQYRVRAFMRRRTHIQGIPASHSAPGKSTRGDRVQAVILAQTAG